MDEFPQKNFFSILLYILMISFLQFSLAPPLSPVFPKGILLSLPPAAKGAAEQGWEWMLCTTSC